MQYDVEDIRARLPHRDPILLPSKVRIELAGKAGSTRFTLDSSKALMFGGSQQDYARELMLECAAQVFGVVLGTAEGFMQKEDERHLLLGFNDVHFDMLDADLDEPFKVGVRALESSGATHVAAFRVEQEFRCVAEGTLMVMKG